MHLNQNSTFVRNTSHHKRLIAIQPQKNQSFVRNLTKTSVHKPQVDVKQNHTFARQTKQHNSHFSLEKPEQHVYVRQQHLQRLESYQLSTQENHTYVRQKTQQDFRHQLIQNTTFTLPTSQLCSLERRISALELGGSLYGGVRFQGTMEALLSGDSVLLVTS